MVKQPTVDKIKATIKPMLTKPASFPLPSRLRTRTTRARTNGNKNPTTAKKLKLNLPTLCSPPNEINEPLRASTTSPSSFFYNSAI